MRTTVTWRCVEGRGREGGGGEKDQHTVERRVENTERMGEKESNTSSRKVGGY